MSTKIYNGYRMNYLDTYELNKFYLELRGMYKEYCKKRYKQLVAKTVNEIVQFFSIREYYLRKVLEEHGSESEEFTQQLTYVENLLRETHNQSQYATRVIRNALYAKKEEIGIDEILRGFSYRYSGDLLHLAKDIIEHRCATVKATQECNAEYDFEGEFCIIPKEGFTNNKVLLLSYGDILADYLRKITGKNRTKKERDFVKKYGLEYYYYQNSTDGPKSISQKKWNERKKDWKLACGEGAPIENGFSLPMMTLQEFETFTFWINEQKTSIVKDVASKEEMVEKIATYIVKDEYVNTLLKESEDPDKKSISFILDLYKQFKDWREQNPELFIEECNKRKEILNEMPVPEKKDTLNTMLLELVPTYSERKNKR